MKDKIEGLLAKVKEAAPNSAEEIEKFRIEFLGRKGLLKDLAAEFKAVPNEQKREIGQLLNRLKTDVQEKIETLKSAVSSGPAADASGEDMTRPHGQELPGARHPISIVRSEILDIFSRIGFTVAEGPEIEDDWHVFSGLNFPPEHPARDMQDTFFVEGDDRLLRTHTSSVQVREMEKKDPPFRIVMPGRVFRNEAVSARSHCAFHQIEGLYIDKDVSFADLKQTLLYFAQEFFGKAKIRLRPSYFPFTEPSAEMDVYWGLETETDYRITKGTGWLEVLGCGMVDPNVLKASGIDPEVYSGFAFGMGIERITMLRYQIGDLRMFFENDMRFLSQFTSVS
ncbi:MAG: phenylalanine--tRNA ligase subunit alpha [Flavobacteriales bacterium]|uniref:phenylalanine--tRNA ligase subunit alpha n=1 Tax=Sanyastnella coralliicola TaxID=3069118 RepID=UPI0027BA03C0|nr:phenylalanine--tRNA ligase subunit alpha [Longitalea sp. SCSIO 12813]MCH2198554.1 phenylalanine--tRNA ligase subunit alpha [Flavobacteriales bacterium]